MSGFEWNEMEHAWQCNRTEADGIHKVGAHGEWEDKAQPQLMKDVGLLPHHKFLDLGCGALRGTLRLIEYLDDGNFYGSDISQSLLDVAMMRYEKLGTDKYINLLKMNDFKSILKFNTKFDYILSVSLLTHLHHDNIEELLDVVKLILEPEGKYYFSLIPYNGKEPSSGSISVAKTNIDWLIDTGLKKELKIEHFSLKQVPSPVGNLDGVTNNKYLDQWLMIGSHL